MNKLTIPSILAATVLIAGIFAFMPVEKASTVHTDLEEKMEAVEDTIKGEINKNRVFLETVNLQGVARYSTVVVADTTPHVMGQVHIAATLPVADNGEVGTCGGEDPLVDVMAGKAGVGLTKVLTAAHNTGIEGRTDIDFDSDNDGSFDSPAISICAYSKGP